MSTMMLTALQCELELNRTGESLFDGFAYPIDPENVLDKEALRNRILMRCGEFEVLYSVPEIFKLGVEVWSKAYKRTFDKWLLAAYSDYNPIENYNMRERFQEDGHNTHSNQSDVTRNLTGSGTHTTDQDGTRGVTESGTHNINGTTTLDTSKSLSNTASGTTTTVSDIDNINSSSASSTKEHKVSAYDASTYAPESQDTASDTANGTASEDSTVTTTTSSTNTGTETIDEDGTNNEQHTTSNTVSETSTNDVSEATSATERETTGRTDAAEDKLHNVHLGERSGNIGVTTSQQMLEQEFKVALFSIYDRIADLFVKEFCIMCY